MSSLCQSDIQKLQDKDLQLRYYLGGLNSKDHKACDYNSFWNCDIKCHCSAVPDDEKFLQVKQFRDKHNFNNVMVLKLLRTYLSGSFNSYKGNWGKLIPELAVIISDYDFVHSTYNGFIENDLKEKEILQLLEDATASDSLYNPVIELLTKYSITPIDFIILAKTSVNHKYRLGRIHLDGNLSVDLIKILDDNNLYESVEYVENYRKTFEEQLGSNKQLESSKQQNNIPTNANNDKKKKTLIKKFKDRFKKTKS